MINDSNFKVNKKEKSNIIELIPKLGRNDLCHCGSGKKYKNCCMRKDQEEERISELLQQVEAVSDKYFSVKDYINLSGYPLTKFDFFLLEFLNITGGILFKYNKTSTNEARAIIEELYCYSKNFIKVCLDCENNCLKGPVKAVSFKRMSDNGFIITDLPESLQKETSMNFFYIEFISGYSSKLEKELCNRIDSETSSDIYATVYWSLIDYVADNCYERCNNDCMIEYEKNAYCNFCTFGSKKLLCPKDGEISYEAVGALETDMMH